MPWGGLGRPGPETEDALCLPQMLLRLRPELLLPSRLHQTRGPPKPGTSTHEDGGFLGGSRVAAVCQDRSLQTIPQGRWAPAP